MKGCICTAWRSSSSGPDRERPCHRAADAQLIPTKSASFFRPQRDGQRAAAAEFARARSASARTGATEFVRRLEDGFAGRIDLRRGWAWGILPARSRRDESTSVRRADQTTCRRPDSPSRRRELWPAILTHRQGITTVLTANLAADVARRARLPAVCGRTAYGQGKATKDEHDGRTAFHPGLGDFGRHGAIALRYFPAARGRLRGDGKLFVGTVRRALPRRPRRYVRPSRLRSLAMTDRYRAAACRPSPERRGGRGEERSDAGWPHPRRRSRVQPRAMEWMRTTCSRARRCYSRWRAPNRYVRETPRGRSRKKTRGCARTMVLAHLVSPQVPAARRLVGTVISGGKRGARRVEVLGADRSLAEHSLLTTSHGWRCRVEVRSPLTFSSPMRTSQLARGNVTERHWPDLTASRTLAVSFAFHMKKGNAQRAPRDRHFGPTWLGFVPAPGGCTQRSGKALLGIGSVWRCWSSSSAGTAAVARHHRARSRGLEREIPVARERDKTAARNASSSLVTPAGMSWRTRAGAAVVAGLTADRPGRAQAGIGGEAVSGSSAKASRPRVEGKQAGRARSEWIS